MWCGIKQQTKRQGWISRSIREHQVNKSTSLGNISKSRSHVYNRKPCFGRSIVIQHFLILCNQDTYYYWCSMIDCIAAFKNEVRTSVIQRSAMWQWLHPSHLVRSFTWAILDRATAVVSFQFYRFRWLWPSDIFYYNSRRQSRHARTNRTLPT